MADPSEPTGRVAEESALLADALARVWAGGERFREGASRDRDAGADPQPPSGHTHPDMTSDARADTSADRGADARPGEHPGWGDGVPGPGEGWFTRGDGGGSTGHTLSDVASGLTLLLRGGLESVGAAMTRRTGHLRDDAAGGAGTERARYRRVPRLSLDVVEEGDGGVGPAPRGDPDGHALG